MQPPLDPTKKKKKSTSQGRLVREAERLSARETVTPFLNTPTWEGRTRLLGSSDLQVVLGSRNYRGREDGRTVFLLLEQQLLRCTTILACFNKVVRKEGQRKKEKKSLRVSVNMYRSVHSVNYETQRWLCCFFTIYKC